ncbi:hypothetical protein LshimejAT787_0800610 [Lyophyllum shimeji]|uniref:Uncharacterized protein n=1 Tax=Lyophyllum shimeji TaxID=47721 RepID=A0A9P3PQJ1_LYOSH|nr:hypothetical protein LshimejAT787_0800610 [Lyophyllum shimeji]
MTFTSTSAYPLGGEFTLGNHTPSILKPCTHSGGGPPPLPTAGPMLVLRLELYALRVPGTERCHPPAEIARRGPARLVVDHLRPNIFLFPWWAVRIEGAHEPGEDGAEHGGPLFGLVAEFGDLVDPREDGLPHSTIIS